MFKSTATSYLSPLSFTAICGQADASRPKAMYIIDGLWRFNTDDPNAGRIKNVTLTFVLDLSGWRVTRATWGAPTDEMIMFLTLKSNNDNTVRAYIDGDQFVFGVTNTDGDATRWFTHTPPRMDTVHKFHIAAVLTKPGAAGGFVKILIDDAEVARAMQISLVWPTETGAACYWMLGLDCRAAVWPDSVSYRRAAYRFGGG